MIFITLISSPLEQSAPPSSLLLVSLGQTSITTIGVLSTSFGNQQHLPLSPSFGLHHHQHHPSSSCCAAAPVLIISIMIIFSPLVDHHHHHRSPTASSLGLRHLYQSSESSPPSASSLQVRSPASLPSFQTIDSFISPLSLPDHQQQPSTCLLHSCCCL